MVSFHSFSQKLIQVNLFLLSSFTLSLTLCPYTLEYFIFPISSSFFQYFSFSLSLSLSLTHTCTHKHTQTHTHTNTLSLFLRENTYVMCECLTIVKQQLSLVDEFSFFLFVISLFLSSFFLFLLPFSRFFLYPISTRRPVVPTVYSYLEKIVKFKHFFFQIVVMFTVSLISTT